MMQGPATFSSRNKALADVSIASRGFSPRQVKLLEGVHRLCADDIDRRLEQMLNDLEQQLFQSAEHARSNEAQRVLLEAQRRIREHRKQLAPAFLARLETALATLSDPPPAKEESNAPLRLSEMSLVDTSDMDESVALKEIGTRCEIRNSLTLFLLGQRLGVVARCPAFENERLPVGPHSLCRILRESLDLFELNSEQRGLVYTQFDRSVMQFLTPLYEALNNYLIAEGVLPHMAYVSPRSKAQQRRTTRATPSEIKSPAADPPSASVLPEPASAPDMRSMPARAGGARMTPRPGTLRATAASTPTPRSQAAPGSGAMPAAPGPGMFPPPSAAMPPAPGDTGPTHPPPSTPADAGTVEHQVLPWGMPEPEPTDSSQEAALFDTLRKLLAGRRSLLDRLKPTNGSVPVTPEQVQRSLEQIQQQYNAQQSSGVAPRFSEIRHELLQQLGKDAPAGSKPVLAGEQGETIDLVDMLFEQIAQEVRPESPGGNLLAQLQLPLLRVALQDQGFFTDRAHPARRMLDVIAETSAYWSSDDEVDRDLIQKMGTLLQRVNEEQSSDPALFRDLITDLTGHLATQQHRAEITERRHVEAARGREKLEIARLQAEEAIEAALAGKTVPKLLKTLLEQVWSDVLALALLRGGEKSPIYQQHLALAQRLIEVSTADATKPGVDAEEMAELRSQIDGALAQVGYTGSDAKDLGDRLLSVTVKESEEATAEPASPTELALKLRDRDRLGQDLRKPQAGRAKKIDHAGSLTAEEKVWHDRLKRLPFGTWFDFAVNQQGDRARRRMSWFSTVTDHCLFVNHRGQRAGDYTLAWLAREMHRGNVKLLEADRGSIVDRAWKAIANALRSFSGGAAPATTSASPAGGAPA